MAKSLENSIRILHVDDDSSILHISKQMLELLNNKFDIDFANSVDEAFQKLTNDSSYDIIISDYEMPLKNGLDFLKELKEKQHKTPFVLFTGRGREEIAIKALNLGADGYYNKLGDPETVYGELAYGIQSAVNRKKTEHQLIEREKRENAIITNVPIGVVTSNSDKYFLTANKVFCSILGYSEEELRKLTFKDFTYSEDLNESIKNMENLTSGKVTSFSQNKRYIRKDGTIIDGKVTVSAVRDEVGRPNLFVAILEDITQRKREEAQLKLFSKFFELASDSVLVHDLNGKILYFNENTYKTRGYTPEEFSKLTVEELDSPDSAKLLDDAIKNLFEKGEITVERLHRCKDGSNLPVEIHARLITIGDQKLVLTIARDITERKKIETNLRQSGMIFEHSMDLFCVANYDGYFKVLNPAWSKTLGYSIEELMAKPWIKFVHPDDRLKTEYSKESLMQGKCLEQFSNRYVCKDGQVKWLSWNATPYPTEKIFFAVARDITERKNTEELLKASEEKFRLYAEGSPVATFVANQEGKYIYVNDVACKMLGYSKEELLSMYIPDLQFEENIAEELRKVEEVKRSGNILGESILKGKNGRGVHVILNGAKLANGDLIASCEDITAHKKAEEALDRKTKELSLIIDSAPSFIFFKNLNGKFVQVNKAFANSMNSSVENLIGKTVFDVFTFDIAKAMTDDDIEVFKSKQPKLNIVEPYQTPTGLGWIRTSKIPIIDNKSEVSGLIGFSEEITEQKKAEKAFEQEKSLLKGIIEESKNAIFSVDSNYHYTSFNNMHSIVMKMLYGAQIEIGKNILDYHTNNVDRQQAKENIDEALNGKEVVVYSEVGNSADDKQYFKISHSPITNEDKKVVGAVVFAEDITEAKKSEQQIKDDYRKLKTLNEKLKVVGSLTRHDIGNKHSIIKSSTYLLKKKTSNPELLKIVNNIESAVDDSRRIFEFSLIFEKIGSDKLTPVDVSDSFNKAVTLNANANKLKVVDSCRNLMVMADSLLPQLFYTFIDNSIKHGQVVKEIQLSCKRNSKDTVLVYEDDGVGVKLDNKAKLFEKGFTTGNGSGLGLYLVKKMIGVYGWTMVETGTEGKGVRFEITIPNSLVVFGKENEKCTSDTN